MMQITGLEADDKRGNWMKLQLTLHGVNIGEESQFITYSFDWHLSLYTDVHFNRCYEVMQA